MKKLIVTCDDCGLSEGINLATVDLHQRGFAKTASVMTNFPAARHALELFSQHPALDVGVHLNLTDGFPLTDIGSSSKLTYDDGSFRARISLFGYALISHRAFLSLAEAELNEQIKFVLDGGVQPRHLTTHLHFHWFPSLREIVYKLARKYDIQWIRNNRLRRVIVPFDMLLLDGVEANDITDEDEEFTSPDYLIGLQYWMKYGTPEKLLDKLLSLQGTIEVVVHPSLEVDDTYPEGIQFLPQERFLEMQYFIEFAQLVQTKAPHDFQLTAGP